MRSTLHRLAAEAALSALVSAQQPEPAANATAGASGILLENLQRDLHPGDDFYRYVNGTWLATHPVPADRADNGTFSDLQDRVREQLRALIEGAASAPDEAAGSDARKVGDFYRAFLDADRAEELGLTPLRQELERIAALADAGDLPELIAHLVQIRVAVLPAFVAIDAKDATRYIAQVRQGGLGLPDRDYYLSEEARFSAIRAAYREHVAKMLALAELREPEARAQEILALETDLAQAQWSKVESRDRDKTYNRYEIRALDALTPGFSWGPFLAATGLAKSPGVVVAQPSFFTAWAARLAATPVETLRAYLHWHLLRAHAPLLSRAFDEESFAFYGKVLDGVTEQKPRWKRAVEATGRSLGEVVGRLYVEQHFPPAAKARMQALVRNLLDAYGASIRELDWMSEATKRRALEKLAKFTVKIGYPDEWEDYGALRVAPDDSVGNEMRAAQFAFQKQVARLGGPIDRTVWGMPPHTVNAYYNASQNEIVFPAAILQPPFFDMRAEDAVNYGAIGAVIGHEIGHGFDDQGSKFDGDGNLTSWWTPEDRQKFEALTEHLIAQYDGFEALPGQHVNGAFTIGENIGDLGGLSIAHQAYHRSLGDRPAPELDGFTADQRLFIGWAQVWCRNYTEQNLAQRLKTDPHAPSEFRCNGVVRNIAAWYDAFGVKPGDALYLPPEQRVKIW
jgi:predicted metalloendopeptidase